MSGQVVPVSSLPSSPPPGAVPAPAPPAVPAAPARSFLAHAKLIGLLTLLSRFVGLGREVVAGHFIGAGLVGSAFTVAFTIPNLFRKLFGEGALAAAFIPLYAQALRDEKRAQPAAAIPPTPTDEAGQGGPQIANRRSQIGNPQALNPEGTPPHSTAAGTLPRTLNPSSANTFAAAAVNLLALILLTITVAGEFLLAALLAFAEPQRMDYVLTLKLTMVMLPYVLLICGGAFLSGILQVHRRFGAPAFAPVLLNVCHIAVVLTGAWLLGIRADSQSAQTIARQTVLVYWLAVFVLVAGVLQGLILLPGLRAVGFRFRPVLHFWTPAVQKMVKLTIPVAIGAGVLQLSVLLDKALSVVLMQGVDASGQMITHFSLFGWTLAYPMELGAPARLYYAQILYQFPLGIFAIALATAIFPALSAQAFDHDTAQFRQTLRQGIEASLWEGLPASIGLVLVAEPAVRLLFQHGQIRAHDAELIARSVQFYAAAIWAFSLQQILSRAYYALHDTVTPLVMSVVTLLVNLLVEIPLVFTPLGEAGMAAGTLASFAVQAIVMLWMLDRRVGGLELSRSYASIAKMLLASLVMGLVCWLWQHLPLYPHGYGRTVWLLQLLVLMLVGGAVYLIACIALRVETLRQILPGRRRTATMPR